MDSFFVRAYKLIVRAWGVDGAHDLTYVADALLADDERSALYHLDRQIEYATARLRAYTALRAALASHDADALEALRDKSTTNIEDWPEG